MKATHKHIGAHEYARKQATKEQLKAATKYLGDSGFSEQASLVRAELKLRTGGLT